MHAKAVGIEERPISTLDLYRETFMGHAFKSAESEKVVRIEKLIDIVYPLVKCVQPLAMFEEVAALEKHGVQLGNCELLHK